MQNKQKFKRSQLVRLIGQPYSPAMTITKIIRTQKEGVEEMDLDFSYQCSWWSSKRKCFEHFEYYEDSIEKAKEKPT